MRTNSRAELDHPQGGVSEAVHDAVGEGAVVGPDAHRDSARLALLHQGREALLEALQLGLVLGVRVLAHGEALAIGEVPGVDAHLLHVVGRARAAAGEKWMSATRGTRMPRWRRARRMAPMLRASSTVGAVMRTISHPARDEALGLGHGGGGVHGVRGGHGLHPDGVRAADADVPHHDHAGRAPGAPVRMGDVGQGQLTAQVPGPRSEVRSQARGRETGGDAHRSWIGGDLRRRTWDFKGYRQRDSNPRSSP